MDEVTRGYIEKIIDGILERPWLQDVSWIREEIPLKSFDELLLGYVLGSCDTVMSFLAGIKSPNLALSTEEKTEIKRILRRRLPEIRERITTELSR